MLTVIVATLFVALASNIVLKRFGLPTIIGYIVTGTVVAYGFNLHDAVQNEHLKEIAEFGVVFLMFTIGLEFSLKHLKRMKHEVFVAGTLQILLSVALAYVAGRYLFGIEEQVAFIIALAVSLSSTAIVLKSFNESGEINRRYGQRALGILLMQDIAVIPILLIIGFMAGVGSRSIASVLGEMLFSAVLLLALLLAFARYLLQPFFRQVVTANSDELFVGTILFLAIGASYLAHMLGFSYSLGAFIAGMLIAETQYKHQAEADLVPFRDLLLGIFFITVGMQIDFAVIFGYLHIIAALLAAVMALKFIIIFMLVRFKENRRTAFKTALSLVQIGEFSLALLELARSEGIVGPPYGQVMIVTIVLSMILTPLILKNLERITERFYPSVDPEPEATAGTEFLESHTVILGFGEFGRNVARALKEHDEPYVAIESNLEKFQRAKGEGEPVIFGNTLKREVLKSARPNRAKKVIVAIDNPHKLYHICQSIGKYVDNSKIVVKVHNSDEKASIADLNIRHIIVENDLSGRAVSAIVMGSERESHPI